MNASVAPRVSGSDVQGERFQWRLVSHVHLDIDTGQGDVHPRGISRIGLWREFSHGLYDRSVSERERLGLPVIGDLIDA